MGKTWRIFAVVIFIQLHLNSCTKDQLLCPSQCMCVTYPAHSPTDEENEWIIQVECEKLHHLPKDLPSNTTRLYITDSPLLDLTQANWSKFYHWLSEMLPLWEP